MSGKLARSFVTAFLLAGLAAPVTARPAATRPEPLPSLLFVFWERLAAPFVALFDSADSDGRGMWDPNGLTSSDGDGGGTDGRGVWDPNG